MATQILVPSHMGGMSGERTAEIPQRFGVRQNYLLRINPILGM